MNYINKYMHQKANYSEIPYIRSGDYYIPNLKLPEETRPIGKWGRMHREYLKEHHPIQYTNPVPSCQLWTYLADLNEHAQEWLEKIIQQIKDAEGISETLKAADPMSWVQSQNSFRLGAKLMLEVMKEQQYLHPGSDGPGFCCVGRISLSSHHKLYSCLEKNNTTASDF